MAQAIKAVSKERVSIVPVPMQVPVKSIRVIPNQNLRTDFNEAALADLVASIRAKGVTTRLWVRRTANGYELIAGERRLRAVRIIGLKEVPCEVYDCDEKYAEELALIENMQREDLHALDYADGFHKMIAEHGYTVAQLAVSVNKSETVIRDLLHLANLPEQARVAFRKEIIMKSHCILIGSIPNQQQRAEFANKVITGGPGSEPLSYRKAKEWKETYYMKDLRGAPFPLNDPTLDREWGYTCTKGSCPHWNGNTPESRQGKQPNICLNPPHYDRLDALNSEREMAKLVETDTVKILPKAGKKIFSEFGHVQDSGYRELKDTVYDRRGQGAMVTIATIVKTTNAPIIVTTDHDGKIRRVIKVGELEKAKRAYGIKSPSALATAADDKKRAAKKREDNAVKRAIAPAVVDQLEQKAVRRFKTNAPVGHLLQLAKFAVRTAPGSVRQFLCRRMELGEKVKAYESEKPLLKDLEASRVGRAGYLYQMIVKLQVLTQICELALKDWGRVEPNADDVAMCAAFGVNLTKIASDARVNYQGAQQLKAAKAQRKLKAKAA